MRYAAVLIFLAAILNAQVNASAAAVRGIAVEKTSFQITLDDGRTMTQEELPGIILTLGDGSGQQRRIKIESVEPDGLDPKHEVVLYSFLEQNKETGAWSNVCAPDPAGRRLGFPVTGKFTADARHVASPNQLLIACTAGAEGKCIRLGYRPWLAEAGEAHYQACIRMIRADYCGDGVSHTKDGTLITMADRIGIRSDRPTSAMTLEAHWAAEGAVCVNHTRIPRSFDMNDLARACPDHVIPRCGDSGTAGLIENASGG